MDLLEERPEVSTRRIEAGRVRVGTRVVTEPRQLDVTVFHESVVIERRPVNEPRPAAARIGSTPPLVVNVEREEPAADLRTYVRERVRVGKRRHEEQRTVTVDARREELDVERHLLDERGQVVQERPRPKPGGSR
ncbi:MAG: YsnF/AvaK domain-containing protein [Candidatus Dormibacteraeota bacterium]|nr:YsnF/AvaK domain-containing protein [Candidatus Dormibacteraeota bacterium]